MYGAGCIYIHPPCHFGMKCTKISTCPFMHIMPEQAVMSAVGEQSDSPAVGSIVTSAATAASSITVQQQQQHSSVDSITSEMETPPVPRQQPVKVAKPAPSSTAPLYTQSQPASGVACKFGVRCRNPRCQFVHRSEKV